MAELDYSNIVNPYDVNLTRTGDTLSIGTPMTGNIPYGASNTDASTTPTSLSSSSSTIDTSIGTNNTGNGSVEVQPVKSDGGLSDLWITNFIRSQNWKPKTVGFYIDGQSGYAEFTNVYVSGNIQALTGLIGGFTIGATDLSATAGGNTTILSSGPIAISAGTTGYPTFTVSQSGLVTATAGTIGGCVIGATSIGSTSFVSGPLGNGWNISNSGTAEFQNVTIRGSIRTSVFEKDTVSAVNGLIMISKADVLSADMTALDTSTLTISGQTTFALNEVLRIKDGTNDEWMLVTNISSAPTYIVTRDLSGAYAPNSNPTWTKGTAVVSTGVGSGTKTGYILLDSSSANSPFIDVYGRNSNTYTDTTIHARLGWLKGITDLDVGLNTTDVWGLYSDSVYLKGTINALSGKIGSANNYWNISSTGITATSTSGNVFINYGKTGFDNTQSGFILGYDYAASLAKFFVGNSTNYFNWDGSNISIAGNITMGTTNYVKGGQTAFKTGDGVFLGYDSTNELDQYNYNSGTSRDLTFADGTTSAVGQSTNVTAGILNIKEVRFFLKKVSSNTATIFCDLYAMGTDFNPTGASLGQTSIAGITNSTFSEYSFSFSSPITVSHTQRYCAVLTSPGTTTGIVARGWSFTGGGLGSTSYYSGAWHYFGDVLDYKVYSTSTGYKFSVGNSGYQFSYNTQNVSLTSSLIIRNSYNPASQPSSPYTSYEAGGFVYYNNGWVLRQNTPTGDNFNIMTNYSSDSRTGNGFNSFYNLNRFDLVTSAGFNLSTGMGDSMYFYKDASGNVRLDASNYLIIGAGGYSVPFTTSYVEIGSAYRKATIHASSLAACPLPSTDNALDQMSLVPPHKDKSHLKDPDKAHYEHIDKGKANRKYFDIDDVPDDITFITREGDKDIDIIRTVGFLFKAVQELNDEIKTLKKKIK